MKKLLLFCALLATNITTRTAQSWIFGPTEELVYNCTGYSLTSDEPTLLQRRITELARRPLTHSQPQSKQELVQVSRPISLESEQKREAEEAVALESPEQACDNFMQILQDASRNREAIALNAKKTQRNVSKLEQTMANRSLATNATAVGGGLATLGWTYKTKAIRFPGEATALEVLKSIATPAIVIASGALVWWKFKGWIVEPYVREHQAEIEKFKRALNTHKEQVFKELTKLRSSIAFAQESWRRDRHTEHETIQKMIAALEVEYEKMQKANEEARSLNGRMGEKTGGALSMLQGIQQRLQTLQQADDARLGHLRQLMARMRPTQSALPKPDPQQIAYTAIMAAQRATLMPFTIPVPRIPQLRALPSATSSLSASSSSLSSSSAPQRHLLAAAMHRPPPPIPPRPRKALTERKAEKPAERSVLDI